MFYHVMISCGRFISWMLLYAKEFVVTLCKWWDETLFSAYILYFQRTTIRVVYLILSCFHSILKTIFISIDLRCKIISYSWFLKSLICQLMQKTCFQTLRFISNVVFVKNMFTKHLATEGFLWLHKNVLFVISFFYIFPIKRIIFYDNFEAS